MPIKKAGFKALRQTIKKTKKNARLEGQLDYLEKKFSDAVAEKDSQAAQNLLPTVYQQIDKGVKAGIMKANTGARRKSRISRLARTITGQSKGQ